MTTIELAKRVQEMRQVQKLYFRERTDKSLEESKRLERELDKLVKEIISDRPPMLPFVNDQGEKAFETGGQEWADWNMDNNPFGD